MVVVNDNGLLTKLASAWIYWRDQGAFQVLRADSQGVIRAFSGSGDAADPGSYGQLFLTEEGRQVDVCMTQTAAPVTQKDAEAFLLPRTVIHGLSEDSATEPSVIAPGGATNTIRRVPLGRLDVPAPLPLTLNIVAPTANQQFLIDPTPAMPTIQAKVKVVNAPAGAETRINFTWEVEVRFNPSTDGCANGPSRNFALVVPSAQQLGDSHTITFPSFIGGNLLIKVSAVLLGQKVTAQVTGTILGANPQIASLRAAIGADDTLARIGFHESGYRQFAAATNGGTNVCPLWSGDRLGGVGIFQLTNPAPTVEQAWSWAANLAAGRAHLHAARATAHAFPHQLAGRPVFVSAVATINAQRAASGHAALTVVIPPWTAAQEEDDAIRGYNGYGSQHDVFGGVLREFRLVMNGNVPALNVNESTRVGTAMWERVPVAARGTSGDPNYVNNVNNANPPTS
jgi:hypothetical protein